MNSEIRSMALLAGVALLACSGSVAQSSAQALYRQKCINCHGVDGLANSGVGKVMKVTPITDPGVIKMSEAEMIEAVRNGAGKMQAYKDSLTDAQIKALVIYFRTLMK